MKLTHRLVLLVLLLQGAATVTLWTLNPTDTAAQAIFGTLLGIDLLGFAMVSYLYRSDKNGRAFSRPWVLAGCSMLVVLLLAVLLLA